MYSKLKNGSLMVMAGLWDRPAAGQDTDTFAIVTVESTSKLAPVSPPRRWVYLLLPVLTYL